MINISFDFLKILILNKNFEILHGLNSTLDSNKRYIFFKVQEMNFAKIIFVNFVSSVFEKCNHIFRIVICVIIFNFDVTEKTFRENN